jgi:hypothetical protein
VRSLGLDDWLGEVLMFRRSALHVEQHSFYAGDLQAMVPWLAGERTPPALGQGSDPWSEQTRPLLDAGAALERLRIHHDEPTPYQQWLRWISPRRLEAGETHRYLTTSAAEREGLLPVPPFPGSDWWLLDEASLVVLRHDDAGHLIAVDATEEPGLVETAVSWWRRAVGHVTIETPSVATPPG